MTVTGGQVVALAQTQDGGRYVFGAKASPTDPDPDRFDCSGLVAWVCRRLGVRPNVPDGAWAQWKHCTPCTLDFARRTPGSLLFVGDGTGVGRNAITHVAISRGDGTTIEARSTRYGIGNWPAGTRFNYAGLIPGVTHGSVVSQPAPAAPVEALFMEDEDMVLRNQDDGAIWAVSATHMHHLTGPEWAQRSGVEKVTPFPVPGLYIYSLALAGRKVI